MRRSGKITGPNLAVEKWRKRMRVLGYFAKKAKNKEIKQPKMEAIVKIKVYNHFHLLHFCFGGGLGDPVLLRSHTGTGRRSLLTIFRGQGLFFPISRSGPPPGACSLLPNPNQSFSSLCIQFFNRIFGISFSSSC